MTIKKSSLEELSKNNNVLEFGMMRGGDEVEELLSATPITLLNNGHFVDRAIYEASIKMMPVITTIRPQWFVKGGENLHTVMSAFKSLFLKTMKYMFEEDSENYTWRQENDLLVTIYRHRFERDTYDVRFSLKGSGVILDSKDYLKTLIDVISAEKE